MDKKALSERDVCTKYITPAIAKAGWDVQAQVRENVHLTKGRVIVRGRLVTRGTAKFADYVLYYQPNANIPLAIVEAKDELPHTLPDGWAWARLSGAVLNIQIGPFGSLLHQSDYVTGGTPLVNPANIQDGHIVPDPQKGVGRETLGRLRGYRLKSRDVVMGRRGEMGKCAIVTVVEDGWLCGTGSLFLRPTEDVLTSFLAVWLRSPSVRAKLEGESVGSTMNNLNLRILTRLVLALPPLAEQRRIVAKAHQLMGLCDELEGRQTKKREVGTRLTKAALDALTSADGPEEFDAAWKMAIDNFDVLIDRPDKITELRRAALGLAVRGRLAEPDPLDESAEHLLERIEAERASAKANGRRVPDCAPLEPADCPYALPPQWRWVRWGQLSLGSDSGWSPQCESRPRNEEEWGVVKVSAVSWDAFQPGENKALPPGSQPRTECAIHKGDFLMSRANTAELVGRSVVVANEPRQLMMSDKIVRCDFSALIDKRYVNLFNRTATARSHYVTHASGTSDSMKNISRDVIFSMPVALPPLSEQRRIVAKVDHLMNVCDDLEAKLSRTEDRAAKLVRAVVQELVV